MGQRNKVMVVGFVAGAAIAGLVAVLLVGRSEPAHAKGVAKEAKEQAPLAPAMSIQDRMRISELEGRLSVQRVSEEGRLRVQTETERGRMELLAAYLREKPTVIEVGGRELIYLPTLFLDSENSRLEQRFYELDEDTSLRPIVVRELGTARVTASKRVAKPVAAAKKPATKNPGSKKDEKSDKAEPKKPLEKGDTPSDSSTDKASSTKSSSKR